MTDTDPTDDRLRALGARARQRAEQDAAWEQVSRGERAVDEVAAQRLEAGDEAQQVERASALHRPFDADDDAALVEALLGRVSGTVAAEAEADDADAESSPVAADAETPTTSVADAAPKHEPGASAGSPAPAANDGRGYWWIGLLAAAAAAVILLWGRGSSTPDPESPPSEPSVLALAPLPPYRLQPDGGLRDQRGDEEAVPDVLHYRADTPLQWVARPDVRVEGEVVARMVAQRSGQTGVQRMRPELLQLRNGVVRIEGHARDLGLSAGAWTIAIAVGRPGAVPSDPDQLWATATTDQVAVMRQHIVLE